MQATGHQTAYWPWLGLIHKIASADVFISWDDVQRSDKGYDARNYILGSNGKQLLTVPVRGSSDTKIKDLQIASDQGWQRKHYRSIQLAYERAPHWRDHADYLKWLYEEQKWTSLAALNDATLTYLLRFFDVKPFKVAKLSELSVSTSKNQQIIDACKKVGAWKYIFGEEGADSYADRELFQRAGIDPYKQTYRAVQYEQGGKGWTPNMSALDLLMYVAAPEAKEIMMAGGKVERL